MTIWQKNDWPEKIAETLIKKGIIDAPSDNPEVSPASYTWAEHASTGSSYLTIVFRNGTQRQLRDACYPEDDPQEPMKARGKFEATTPAQLLKAILCYECQTCEAPDFEGSALFKQLQIIKHRAMSALIKDCDWAIPDYTHTVTAHAA